MAGSAHHAASSFSRSLQPLAVCIRASALSGASGTLAIARTTAARPQRRTAVVERAGRFVMADPLGVVPPDGRQRGGVVAYGGRTAQVRTQGILGFSR